ncbi:uncharacterized protein BO88DRAFT_416988 [Aspergillus vadensis CBS 113365]|uniref:Uncharacterized protein n=1 Tax=Aspergillus vadensis (strain CBS 113365 / IMI 142717 / IBT 24658) TaxID=1448311 RepID=A0A319B2T3_ASPVC|nr:hypothetical protein BO88DRAFT_416988 [Aspergillus vadensis CBS 113365]PYH67027.1 hypothetical protein BO88DRAFT_416988 [Aspergillus vadensis CBS 113365]
MYEAHASASMEGHRWSVSDMDRASNVTILKDRGAERGLSITYPADVTARGEGNKIRDDENSTLPSNISDNETLPVSFWGWTWSQSGYLTGSETDGFLHPSIPASQAAGWPFRGKAEQPQYPSRSGIMPFLRHYSQELYPPGPSFDAPDSIPSSNALGLSSILETAPPSFPRFPRLQHVEDGSLALPAESLMLLPPWDPLAPVSAALPMTDFHRHSLHQQPSAPAPIMMDYNGTEVSPFDNISANRQEPSCNVTVPEDQVEHHHST